MKKNNFDNNFKKTILEDTFSEKYHAFENLPLELKKYLYISGNYMVSSIIEKPSGHIKVINENEEVIKYTFFNCNVDYKSNNFFIKRDIISSITINKIKKEIYFWKGENNILNGLFSEIFKYLNITWCDSIPYNILKLCMTKTMFKNIIFNKVTNPEKFYKAYMSISLKINKSKNVSWRLVKEYIEFRNRLEWYNYTYIPINIIINNTTNINLTLKKLLSIYKNSDNNGNEYCEDNNLNRESNILFKDLLKDAQILGKKVNPIWSHKRMQAEHTNMTIKINEMFIKYKHDVNKIEDISYKGIENIAFPNNTVKLLKNELDVFTEAATMHHCLYNSYYKKIAHKDYFAFSANFPERCTIGVTYNTVNNKFIIDQIYKNYDEPVTIETRKYFETWINSDDMQKFFINNYYLNIAEYHKNNLQYKEIDERLFRAV